MNESYRRDIALMRFSIISPLATGLYDGKIKAFFMEASKRSYNNPKGEAVTFSATSIERWYYAYKNHGFDALIPQVRIDQGRSRKIDGDILEQIKWLKENYPRLPATLIYQKLLDNGTITKGDLSLSTINRCVNALKLDDQEKVKKQYLRYEREHINTVWYGDSSAGPWMKIDGKNRRVWIIAFIDDASRMVVGIDLFFQDNTENVFRVLKSAIAKYGLPKICSYDNGAAYKNKQMTLLAARLGFALNYNQPYTPTSKSKIERFFRTLKDLWMSQVDTNDMDSLEDLRMDLMTFMKKYHHKVHSSLKGKSPFERFFQEPDYIKRLDQEILDASFLLEMDRTVSADGVIQIDKVKYEVPYYYASQKIRLRYTPDMTCVFVEDAKTGDLTPIKLLNKYDNAKIKREKPKLSGGNRS